jgi:hypothetical protein
VGRELDASVSCTGGLAAGKAGTAVAKAAAHLPVSPMMMYLKRYLHALMHVSLTEARGSTRLNEAAASGSLRVAHDAARPSCQRHCCCCLGLVGRYRQRALVFTTLKMRLTVTLQVSKTTAEQLAGLAEKDFTLMRVCVLGTLQFLKRLTTTNRWRSACVEQNESSHRQTTCECDTDGFVHDTRSSRWFEFELLVYICAVGLS